MGSLQRFAVVVITLVLSLGSCIADDESFHEVVNAAAQGSAGAAVATAADLGTRRVSAGAELLLMSQQLKAGGLVPEVVPALPDNVLDMRVSYDNKDVPIGVQLRLVQTQIKPSVQFHGNGFGGEAEKYTLVMVDPDAPSPSNPVLRNILHWLVTDIPGSTPTSQEIWVTGQEKIPYMGPAPPEGLHRYVLLLFKQELESSQGQQFNEVMKAPPSRVAFSLAEFVKKYNLGMPVAGYYFRAAHGS